MTTIQLQQTHVSNTPMQNASYQYYDRWIETLDLPIYKGYYVEDSRTLELGRWKDRECDAAFLQLAGQEGVTGVYVTEIAPGKTLPTFRVAVDECVYVLLGRGITQVEEPSGETRTFEWGKHAMFLLPANHPYRLTNTSGSEPARARTSSTRRPGRSSAS